METETRISNVAQRSQGLYYWRIFGGDLKAKQNLQETEGLE